MVDLSERVVEEVVRRTLEAIRDSELTDINEVDRIRFALSRSSVEIGVILNEVLITQSIALSDECVSLLRELHMCLTHMFLEWESRHLRISNRVLGRPRIAINIPLVKFYSGCYIYVKAKCHAMFLLGVSIHLLRMVT